MISPMGTNEVLIHDGNAHLFIDPVHDGEVKKCGTFPRNWAQQPLGFIQFAPPFDIPLIPESEWQTRLDAQISAKAQLSNIRNKGMNGSPIPSRDQNGKGYCWAHSGVSAHLLTRAVNGDPYLDLSAYAIACVIKQFRDEGGWGSEGVEFQGTKGCPTGDFWPQQSMSRANDKPETWANAVKQKYAKWMDLDPNKMEEQLVTCLLLNIPCIVDYNWWSHSVCAADIVELKKTGRIWNSWGDSWSENGMGSLSWNKFVPDDAWACVTVTPSIKQHLPSGHRLLAS